MRAASSLRAAFWFVAIGLASVAVSAAELPAETPAGIGARALGHGVQLTDDRGQSLYTYDVDLREPGTSSCVGECAVMRPPLLAETITDKRSDGWATITRSDGSRQWAYEGRPLYRYARDLDPGAVFGVGEGWNAAFIPMTMPAEFSIAATVEGEVLATATGKTLYVRASDANPKADCDHACERSWLPIKAPWGGRGFAPFSIFERADGIHQWAFKERPLYAFAGDARPGDLNGSAKGGQWRPVILEPAPAVPDWVTVVKSDGGALYANSGGMTLYRLMHDKNATEQSYLGGNQCDAACLEKYWIPVRAESRVPRSGYWSVIDSGPHGLQWAYQGMPLYLLSLETQPGQLYYTTYRQFQWMKPIMYALPALQGVF